MGLRELEIEAALEHRMAVVTKLGSLSDEAVKAAISCALKKGFRGWLDTRWSMLPTESGVALQCTLELKPNHVDMIADGHTFRVPIDALAWSAIVAAANTPKQEPVKAAEPPLPEGVIDLAAEKAKREAALKANPQKATQAVHALFGKHLDDFKALTIRVTDACTRSAELGVVPDPGLVEELFGAMENTRICLEVLSGVGPAPDAAS